MRKNRLVITVSDINSTKSYNISKVLKKIVFWGLLITIAVVAISFFTISKLATNVNELSSERDILTEENNNYSKQIELKVQKIKELGDELEKIEDIIGINSNDEADLIKRATLATLSSSQKKYMLQTIPSGCPLKTCETTSSFGWRTNPVTKSRQFHKGVDLRAARRTPVYATADGVVRYVQDRNQGSFGRVVIVSHNFGFETVYGHLRFADVKVGDVIKKGQKIARSGNSGRSSGPHLHYEVVHASKVLEPKHFINWNFKNYEKIFEKQRRVKWESLVKLVNTQNHKLGQR